MKVSDAHEATVEVENAESTLFHSRIEIAKIMEELARGQTLLSVEFGDGEQLFLTRVLRVDPGGEFFAIEYSEQKQVNTALLEEQSARFRANAGHWRIEFAASAPTEAPFEDRAAIRFELPQALVRSKRREHPRFKVPGDVSLRCIADCAGVASFEARVIDISRGGMGGLIHDTSVNLRPGTLLKGCRIVLPGADAIVADLEVRYSMAFVQADGSLVQRSGVRFLAEPRGFDALLKNFVIDYGEKPPTRRPASV